MKLCCGIFETAFGSAAIVAGGAGIKAFYLPSTREAVLRRVRRDFPEAVIGGNACSKKAQEIVKRYFKGHRVSFKGVRTDLSSCGSFTRKVLARTARIPYGTVRSYMWAGGGKPRAAGAALAANPVPVIIPCHRVVKSGGKLGGFSAGIEWKKRLLSLERAVRPAFKGRTGIPKAKRR